MTEIPETYDRSSPTPLAPPEPVFMGDPTLDTLTDVVLKLAGELWVVKNRLRLIEEIALNEAEVSQKIEEAYQTDSRIIRDHDELSGFVQRVFEETVAVGTRGVRN